MDRETIVRIASLTKPIVAAAVMTLVDDGHVVLDDPVDEWLPELSAPTVVREPGSPRDDVVPAARSITGEDLLSSRAGYGFPSDFTLPVVGLLFSELKQGPTLPQTIAAPDDWMAALGRIPLLHQPGEAWLYNTCSDIQGVLIGRVTGQPLPEFLAERIFEPLRMLDTGFEVPADKLERFSSFYETGPADLELKDAPGGHWSQLPAFPSGAGGLVSTADDLLAFGRMLLAGGTLDGQQVLSPQSVARMTSNCLTPAQRSAGQLFLEGQGWGFGGSVDVNTDDPWTVPGRYGWVGGTGTSAHVIPSLDIVSILLTQVAMDSPTPPTLMRDFWRYAADLSSR
ncbi:MAG: serine hydrolase [Pseudonocardiales bacterium]|nr:MAG: serine hydrolase [Pseudonocardiales bacterium]